MARLNFLNDIKFPLTYGKQLSQRIVFSLLVGAQTDWEGLNVLQHNVLYFFLVFLYHRGYVYSNNNNT